MKKINFKKEPEQSFSKVRQHDIIQNPKSQTFTFEYSQTSNNKTVLPTSRRSSGYFIF